MKPTLMIFIMLISLYISVKGQGATLCPHDASLQTSPNIDGNIETGAYRIVTEDPFAAPISGGSATSSDFIGEGSSCHVAYQANTFMNTFDNICARNWGTADIHNLYITWDSIHLYLLVEGPSAYGAGTNPDRMDLFIAIDTDNDTTATLAHTAAPFSKRVDFAGWDPEFFVAVEGFGYAEFTPAGGTAIGSDIDINTTSVRPSFEFSINSNRTECRIPWSLLGGKPSDTGGEIWNFAVYTTYDDNNFDVYDTGPGIGNGTSFEAIGDVPWDADYCGSDTDPVTGMADDPCSYSESDGNLGSGNNLGDYRQPGSDNAQQNGGDNADFDTVEEYYRIANLGQSFDACRIPLPVVMGDTWISQADKRVSIAWETHSERNVSHFILQRKNTHQVWETLTTHASLGDTDDIRRYEFVDGMPMQGENVYRIIVQDKDGSKQYYPYLNTSVDLMSVSRLFPNPTTDILHIHIPPQITTQSYTVSIISPSGKVIHQTQQVLDANVYELKCDTKELADGLYFLRITNKHRQSIMHKPFMKQ